MHDPYEKFWPDYTREEELSRANQAKAVLENPIFSEAFESYRATLIQAWSKSGVMQRDERENIWLQLQICNAVERNLRSYIETGQLVEHQLTNLNNE